MNASAKMIVIVDITGQEGSSVARAFVRDPGWRVRGLARDPSSEASRYWIGLGTEIVGADFASDDSIRTHFEGAVLIFFATDFWFHARDHSTHTLSQMTRTPIAEVASRCELEEGMRMVTAAAYTISLQRLILSLSQT